MKKSIIILIGILFLECIFPVFFLFGAPTFFTKEDKELPDVRNQTKEEAIQILKEFQLKIEYVESRYPYDTVLYTYPKERTKIKENSTVYLYVSNETYFEKMIQAKGLYYEDIEEELEELKNKIHLNLTIEMKEDSFYPTGYILEQAPLLSEILRENDTIHLTISKNSGSILFPSLIGCDIINAMELEEKYHLSFIYDFKYSSSYEENRIISQSIPENTIWKKENDTPILIVVSKGKE